MKTVFSRTALILVIAAAFSAAACGSGSADLSPTGPSGNGGSTTGGATITGRVNGGSGLRQTTTSAVGNITVTVNGTTISAPVDGLGNFTLTGVPAGTIELKFSGPGVNATVTITVGAQEQIQIAVTVNGNSAQVESQHRSGSGQVEVEGRITEVDATARTLRVAGTLVSVPTTATIRRGSQTLQFADLGVGTGVEVRGTLDGTTIRATEVKVDSPNSGHLTEREGIVSALSGTCPALTFTLGTMKVTTSGSTYFKESACANVKDGARVEVKGVMQPDGSMAAMVVKPEDDDDDDEDDDEDDDDVNEAEVEGALSGLSGTCPALGFTVGTTKVTTTSTTRFDGVLCGSLKNGDEVEVKGVRQMDGSIVATRVELED
jgi:hypothetical protein